MTAPPVGEAVPPLWQPLLPHVLVPSGVELLELDAYDGYASAVRTCSWEPKNTRAMRIPVKKRSIAGRNLFTCITP